MRLRHYAFAVLIGMLSYIASSAIAGDRAVPPEVYRRTVFLGDSITDGNTYPQLVRDALKEAKLPAMESINAGIGGDTAAGMWGRLDRDVLPHHPTLVALSAGANDALHDVPADAYERDVRAIADRLKREHISFILLTPNVLGPKQQAKGQKNLDAYEEILRRIAKEQNLPLAEVNRRQKADEAAGHLQLAPDDLHPNWNGQTMIARAVLDAMGYADVRVPDDITNTPMPGVISDWRVKRVEANDPPLKEENLGLLRPDKSWLTLTLPETKPIPDFHLNTRWLDDCRTLGASVSLRQQPAGKYIGVAVLKSDKLTSVKFTTGAELEQVWLNGKLIYQNDWKHGYHIGRESVMVDLKEGDNAIVIRTGAVFFLSANPPDEK